MPRKQAPQSSNKASVLNNTVAIVLLFLPFTTDIFRAYTMHSAAKAEEQAKNNNIYGI